MSESDDNIEVPFDLFWNRRYKSVELEARVHTRIDALLVKYAFRIVQKKITNARV
jgi:hypothetical protein